MLLFRSLLVSKSFEPNFYLLLGRWFDNNIQIPCLFMVLTPLISLSTSHPRRCGMLFPCFDNVIILGPKLCSILSSIHKIRHLYPNTRISWWGFMLTGGSSPVPILGNPQWCVPLMSESKNPIRNQVWPLIWWRLVNSSPGVDCLVGFHIPLVTMNHQQRNCYLATLNDHRFWLLKEC